MLYLTSRILHLVAHCVDLPAKNVSTLSVLIYGAKIWSLHEDDKRRINATEMDALRQSPSISKLDRKMNEYIRGKMDAQDMIFDDITRKQVQCHDHRQFILVTT